MAMADPGGHVVCPRCGNGQRARFVDAPDNGSINPKLIPFVESLAELLIADLLNDPPNACLNGEHG
jgi:hypothetical protein